MPSSLKIEPAMTPEEADARAIFKQITGGTDQDYADILTLPAAAQKNAMQAYKDAIYATPPDVLGKFVAALTVVGAIAGAVTGVSSAAGGALGLVQAIKSL